MKGFNKLNGVLPMFMSSVNLQELCMEMADDYQRVNIMIFHLSNNDWQRTGGPVFIFLFLILNFLMYWISVC